MTLYASRMESPIGPLTLTVTETGTLTRIDFGATVVDGVERNDARCGHVRAQLEEYFRGERRDFELMINPAGTPFQRLVWQAVLGIPCGTTLDYREVGQIIGRPGGARAVGGANARNPIPIVIPCHRVVGAVGNLTGYGGGLQAKRFLLELEGCELRDNGCVGAGSWMSCTHPELYEQLIPREPRAGFVYFPGVSSLN